MTRFKCGVFKEECPHFMDMYEVSVRLNDRVATWWDTTREQAMPCDGCPVNIQVVRDSLVEMPLVRRHTGVVNCEFLSLVRTSLKEYHNKKVIVTIEDVD